MPKLPSYGIQSIDFDPKSGNSFRYDGNIGFYIMGKLAFHGFNNFNDACFVLLLLKPLTRDYQRFKRSIMKQLKVLLTYKNHKNSFWPFQKM